MKRGGGFDRMDAIRCLRRDRKGVGRDLFFKVSGWGVWAFGLWGRRGKGVGVDLFNDILGVEGLMGFGEGVFELRVVFCEPKDDGDLFKVALVESIEVGEDQCVIIVGMEEVALHGLSPHEAMCSRSRLRARKIRTRTAPGEHSRRCAISLAEYC